MFHGTWRFHEILVEFCEKLKTLKSELERSQFSISGALLLGYELQEIFKINLNFLKQKQKKHLRFHSLKKFEKLWSIVYYWRSFAS